MYNEGQEIKSSLDERVKESRMIKTAVSAFHEIDWFLPDDRDIKVEAEKKLQSLFDECRQDVFCMDDIIVFYLRFF